MEAVDAARVFLLVVLGVPSLAIAFFLAIVVIGFWRSRKP